MYINIRNGVDINTTKIEGDEIYSTGLMEAAQRSQESVVDILSENGADVNKTKNGKFSSALMLACTKNNA